ncbi:hypothetical protein AAEY33_09830 [Peribacillus simplex]
MGFRRFFIFPLADESAINAKEVEVKFSKAGNAKVVDKFSISQT